jgi:chromosomal replication initiation ATPase DnaA
MSQYGDRDFRRVKQEHIDEIFREAEDKYSVPKERILGKRRLPGVIHARFYVYKRLRTIGLSYPMIGLICNRDHTTVISAMKRLDGLEAWGLMERNDASSETVIDEFDSHPQDSSVLVE